MIDHDALLRRREELGRSLGNAALNRQHAERDLDDAPDAEQRVRGAIPPVDELIEEMVL